MERLVRISNNAADKLSSAILAFSGAIIGVTVVLILAESLSRNILGYSRAFMEEFPRLLVPFFVFPMMGVLYKAKRHITVDILPTKLAPVRLLILNLFIDAVVVAVALQMFFAGLQAVSHFRMMGLMSVTEWPFPMWWAYLSFPIGFGLLTIFVLSNLLENLWRLYQLIKKNDLLPASTGDKQ